MLFVVPSQVLRSWSHVHLTNLWKAKTVISSEFPWPRAVTRHAGGCMAAVSSSVLFSFGLVARGHSVTHHLWLVRTVIQLVCVWICFRTQHPGSTSPRCPLSSRSSRHQLSIEVCCQKKQAVLHWAPNGVKGWVVFISGMDLLRKGIPLEAKGTLPDGWGR